MNPRRFADGAAKARRVNWTAPLGGFAIGVVLIAITLSQGHGSLNRAAVAIAMCVAYTVILIALQLRSETVKTMVGRPADERWLMDIEHRVGPDRLDRADRPVGRDPSYLRWTTGRRPAADNPLNRGGAPRNRHLGCSPK